MTDCVKERNFALLGFGHTLRLLLEMIIEITHTVITMIIDQDYPGLP